MLSEYEKLRLANIARNQAVIKALGLDTAAAATKPVQATKKRARSDKAPAQAPTRGSRRLQGEAADEEGDDETAVVPRTVHQPLKRASREPRLTADQSARLNAMEEASAAPLKDDELLAVEQAREYIDEQVGGWSDKRRSLEEAADMFGLRWPSWLAKLEEALPPMGTTQTARDQTMYAIMRGACGIGLEYHDWPFRVGVLLANHVDDSGAGESVRPRVLTLGCDTEMLRREGQRLEAKFGRDAGNGWAYNHALGKLRHYQAKLLGADDPPSAPSVYDLENDESEGGGQ